MKILIAGKPEFAGNYASALQALDVRAKTWLPDFTENTFLPSYRGFESILSDFDGLLLPGGGDIHPAFYGQPNSKCICIDPILDLSQFFLLGSFLRANKPVLGICKGMQLINTALGGTLHQDLPHSLLSLHSHQGKDSIHTVSVLPNTFLSRLYNDFLVTNSAHHQSVDTMAPDLLPAAYGPGNVLEAFFHPVRPILGVQWHPERMCGPQKSPETHDGLPLLRYFLSLCFQ